MYCSWIISKSWYLDITSISLVWLHLLDSNVQCQAPHALRGMNPTPHAIISMMPNNISEVKRTNKGCLTYGICCAWAWSSYHFNSIFFFHLIKGLLFIPFLPCMWVAQNTSIHRTVILLPKPPRTNRWTPWFLACIQKECVCSKCWQNNHLATWELVHTSTLQKQFEPLWAHSLTSPFSSWIRGRTSWSVRSGTINESIAFGPITTYGTRWRYCTKATYIMRNYT